MFFSFSFYPSSFSSIFFYICFLSSSSSFPFPILNSLSSYNFFYSLFGLHLFILFIYPLLLSLSSFNPNWFSSFLVYSSFHFNCSFSFLMLCFPQRHTSPWCATNSVDLFLHLYMFTSHFHVYLFSFPS